MNKKKIIIGSIVIFLLFASVFIIIVVKNNNNKNSNSNKNHYIKQAEVTTQKVTTQKLAAEKANKAPDITPVIQKYKDSGYMVVNNDMVFCDRDVKCFDSVLKNCIKSISLVLSKAKQAGYIVTVAGINSGNKNLCDFTMIKGTEPKNVLNCSVEFGSINQSVLDDVFEFKDNKKYCK